MRNIVINKCTVRKDCFVPFYNPSIIFPFVNDKYPSLFLKDCYDVCIYNVVINSTLEDAIGLSAVNVLGEFSLIRIKSTIIKILYTDKEYTNWNPERIHLNYKLSIFQFELIRNVLDENRKENRCKKKNPYSNNILLFVDADYYTNGEQFEPYRECLSKDDSEDELYGLTLQLY